MGDKQQRRSSRVSQKGKQYEPKEHVTRDGKKCDENRKRDILKKGYFIDACTNTKINVTRHNAHEFEFDHFIPHILKNDIYYAGGPNIDAPNLADRKKYVHPMHVSYHKYKTKYSDNDTIENTKKILKEADKLYPNVNNILKKEHRYRTRTERELVNKKRSFIINKLEEEIKKIKRKIQKHFLNINSYFEDESENESDDYEDSEDESEYEYESDEDDFD
jgi:hypothetical protein